MALSTVHVSHDLLGLRVQALSEALRHRPDHLDRYAGPERLFVSKDGSPMRGDAVRQAFERARHTVGMDDFRFHDLRHTGQTLAAAAGANLADLMKRLGHTSTIAAKRYLHATQDRDRELASALSKLAEKPRPPQPPSITMR
jgi:integrase